MAKDAVEAIKWYRKAADQGNASAQSGLGWCYERGEGVPKDSVEAVKWYRKAAVQGNTGAQNNLGVCYDKGEGVTKDYVEAYKWYNLAAAQGYEVAIKNRDIIEKLMTRKQMIEGQRLAREFKPRIMLAPEGETLR